MGFRFLVVAVVAARRNSYPASLSFYIVVRFRLLAHLPLSKIFLQEAGLCFTLGPISTSSVGY